MNKKENWPLIQTLSKVGGYFQMKHPCEIGLRRMLLHIFEVNHPSGKRFRNYGSQYQLKTMSKLRIEGKWRVRVSWRWKMNRRLQRSILLDQCVTYECDLYEWTVDWEVRRISVSLVRSKNALRSCISEKKWKWYRRGKKRVTEGKKMKSLYPKRQIRGLHPRHS